jgi:RHS repeat-associated protein
VREIVSPSPTATVLDQITYGTYGGIITETNSSNGDRFKYDGGEWDGNLGLNHFDARWVDVTDGRWLSQDRLGLGPDRNPYRYVGNGPVNFVDHTGLYPEPWTHMGPPPSQSSSQWGYGSFVGGVLGGMVSPPSPSLPAIPVFPPPQIPARFRGMQPWERLTIDEPPSPITISLEPWTQATPDPRAGNTDLTNFIIGMIPFVGPACQIVRGIVNGNPEEIALGTAGFALDILMAGAAFRGVRAARGAGGTLSAGAAVTRQAPRGGAYVLREGGPTDRVMRVRPDK